MTTTSAPDLDRFNKDELRCLVRALWDHYPGLTPQVLANALWHAACQRADRLRTIEEEALRAYLVAHEIESKALNAGRAATRLTRTRMDTELAWRRAKRALAEALGQSDLRWNELQATWTSTVAAEGDG